MTDSPFFAGEIATTQTEPAYDLEPWTKRTSTKGPQCSASDDFCFFCSFTEPDDDSSDGAALWEVVRQLAEKKKELPKIVETVLSIYNKHLKHNVTYTPVSGEPQHAPEWKRESISRHLLFSSEFPELFDTTVESIYRSLIVNQNRAVIDAATGRIIPEARKELTDIIDCYARYRKSTSKEPAPKPRKRKAKAIEDKD